MTLADKLKAAVGSVEARDYTDVTHEFFGIGAVVEKAKEAETFAAEKLKNFAAAKPQT